MQITIDSRDLLNIFIEAGIGNTDAKALILDIIMLQENPPPKPVAKKETRQATSTDHLKLKPVTQMPAQQPVAAAPQETAEVDDYSIDEEDEEDEEEERPAITRVNGKSLSRPNFSSFGGDSTGLK